MTEQNNAADQAGPHFTSVSPGDLLGAAADLASQLLAAVMDETRNITELPAPQMPHIFAAALGAVAATGSADPERGELFRAGLTVEQFGEVLAQQVRANFALHSHRIAAMLEAEGAASLEELDAKREARRAAFEEQRAAAEAEEAATAH